MNEETFLILFRVKIISENLKGLYDTLYHKIFFLLNPLYLFP